MTEMELIPAVAYYRASSEDQEDSVPQQRQEVLAFAAGKYRIIREYVDDGRSGSKDQERRTAFRQMILDADKGEFKTILCWSTSRYGRLHSKDPRDGKDVLIRNGIVIDTVKDGRIDLSTMAGRVMDCVSSEMNHEYSRQLALASMRGRLEALERGCWVNGSIPYGYHRLYVGTDGTEYLRTRTESFRKLRGMLLHLVIVEAEAAIVRWIFDRLVNHDAARRQLALELNRRGVPPPECLGKRKGKGWSENTIKRILTNPASVRSSSKPSYGSKHSACWRHARRRSVSR